MDDQSPQPVVISPVSQKLQILDRVFLSAEDAALFGHEQVGRRRDHRFFAYILQRDDQRFVLSELTEQASAPRAVFQELPDKHSLHSRFYSHPGMSTLEPETLAHLNRTTDEMLASLMMFSVEELHFSLVGKVPIYLSGAEDSLIGFTPSGAGSSSLQALLGTALQPGTLALGLGTGAAKPEQLVVETAAAGDLQVIVSNGRWRPRGKVTATVAPAPWERHIPQRVSFGAVFPSAEAAALDRHSRESGLSDEERTLFGFILKQKGKDEYIATELIPVGDGIYKLFSKRGLFGDSRKPSGRIFPEAFELCSYFYMRQRVKRGVDASSQWLSQHFVAPRDLVLAVDDMKKHRRLVTKPDCSLSLYAATQDGALLKYDAREGTKLFDDDDPTLNYPEVVNNVASGKLTSTGYVRVVANSGQLRVMRTSLCWDRIGLIDRYWIPSLNLERRTLGPVFLTANDAAVYARSQVRWGRAEAYGGLILVRADGFYVATEPVAIAQENFDIERVFPDDAVRLGQFPTGCTIIARYRSRNARALSVLMSTVDKALYRNMLSIDVVYSAFLLGVKTYDEYLFAPDGSITRYRPGPWDRFRADLGIVLSNTYIPPRDLRGAWIKEQIYSRALTPTDLMKKLAKAGELQVVVGSQLWGAPRTVAEFEPYPEQAVAQDYPRALTAPAYTPVCIREKDAARLAHEQAGSRSELSFGFILRKARDGTYVSTLPVAEQGSRLAYDRVFPDVLPYRYVDSAIILCAEQTPQGLPDEDYRHFFSPMDVSLARNSVKNSQGYRPIYFSCADGALLRLRLSAFEPSYTLDEHGQVEFRPNPFATLEQARRDWDAVSRGLFTVSNYIRRMAAAGELEVLVTSAYWSCAGPVGQDWQPRMPARSADELWTLKPELPLGPVFHHPDDAAYFAHRRAGTVSGDRSSHASAILTGANANSYVALEPIVDPASPHEAIKRIFRTASDASTNGRNKAPGFPDGYKLMAGHQLISPQDPIWTASDLNFPPPNQVMAHTHALKAKGFDITAYYYSTRGGALFTYVPAYSPAEKALLLTEPALAADQFISRLADIGILKVLRAASDWMQAGRLGILWRIEREQASAKTDKPTRDEL